MSDVKVNEILKPREIKAIKLYLESSLTSQQIAEECGYKNRSSLYKILEKPQAREAMLKIADESVQSAINILKTNSCQVAKRLVEIAKGNKDNMDNQTIYATLNAINSVLEKSGLTTKNITLQDLRDNKDNINTDDILNDIAKIEDEIDNDKVISIAN